MYSVERFTIYEEIYFNSEKTLIPNLLKIFDFFQD